MDTFVYIRLAMDTFVNKRLDMDTFGYIRLDMDTFVDIYEAWYGYITDECMTLFDEDLYKTYRQQGKEIYDFDMNNMIIIKDELLAVGYMDGSLRLWDMKMGQYIWEVAYRGKLHVTEDVMSWTNVGIEILFKDHNARIFRGTHHQKILNVKKIRLKT